MVSLAELTEQAASAVRDGQDVDDAAWDVVYELDHTEVFGLLAAEYTGLRTNELDPNDHEPDSLLMAARLSLIYEVTARLGGTAFSDTRKG